MADAFIPIESTDDLPVKKASGGLARFGRGGVNRIAEQAAAAARAAGKAADAVEQAPTEARQMLEEVAPAARQIDTPEFKNWFGESKVVDAEGSPLRLYHGAKQDIEGGIFRPSEKGMLGKGIYFTSNPQEAEFYTSNAVWRTDPNIVPAYLSLRNPYIAKGKWDADAAKAAERGHDGVILLAPDGSIDWAVALEPTQIKSAIGNEGTFDPTNPVITKKDGGPVYDPDRINQMVEQLMVPQMADGGPVRNLPQERREARRARATPPESLEGAFAQLEAAERAARLRGAGTPLGGAYRPDLYQYGGDSLLGAVLPIQRRIITPESQSAEFTGYDDRGRPMYEVITTPAELGPVERGPSLGTRLFGAAKELYNQATENPMGIVGGIENYLQGQMQAGGAGGRTWNPETQQLTEFDPAGIPGMAMGTGYALSTPIDGAVAGMAVKQKGGNWLAGDIEKKVAPLRRRTINNMDPAEKLAELERAYGPEGAAELVASGMYPSIREDAAINNWIDKALSKYIRNEMATPEDPVRLQAEAWAATQADLLAKKDAQIAKATADMERARAERGFTPEMMTRSQAQIRELQKERDLLAAQTGLHMPSREVSDFMLRMNENRRIGGGMPPTPMGVSPEARFWEALSDDAINPHHAGEYKREAKRGFTSIMAENPWLQQLPDTAVVNRFSGGSTRAHLGFGHLIDEMRNALNPESGLPRELLINPKDLPKLTVPQMVERVSKINAWRAVQKAEADAAIAANAATFPYRTYETIPGTTMPNERGLRWVELKTPEDGSSDALKDALKYEGEMLQHCVGGYCPDVEAGQSRIFSLRDARGQPYTTIEVKPGRSPSQSEAASQARAEGLRGQALAARVFDLMEGKHIPPEIKQIKGTQNRAPAEEYLPFVQDFVRSERWGDVWDTENAGLYYAHPDWLGMNMPENLVPKNLVGEAELTDLLHRAQQAGLFGDRQYLTGAELEDIMRQQLQAELGQLPKPPEMAKGGPVKGYANGGEVSEPKNLREIPDVTLGYLVRKYGPAAAADMLDELGELRGAYNAGLETQIAPDEGGLPGLALQTASLPELPGALVTLAGAGVAAIDPETGLRIIDAGDKYAAMLPEDIADYSARYDAHLDRMLEKYGLPATGSLDPMDRFALAAGEMTGQLPMPAAWLNKLKAAKRIPKAIPLLAEYFGPVVDPKVANYAVGTTVGGALRQLEEPAPEKATLTYSPPAFPKMAEGGAFDADRINAMADQLMGKPQAFAKGGIGRTADRAADAARTPSVRSPDSAGTDYLTPAEREFLSRSVRTGMQVSERVPTSPKFTGDPFDPNLTIGVDVIRQSPEQMRKQAETMSQYINYPVDAPTDPESVFGLLGDQSVENLLFLYDQMPADVRRLSSRWYEGANRLADEAAAKYGIPIEGAAGVYAALSPQMDWFKNVSLGNRVMDIARNYGDVRFTPEMLRRAKELIAMPGAGFNPETAAIVDLIKNSTLSQLDTPQKKAVWLRLYDEAHNPRGYSIVDPLGNIIGPSVTGRGEEARVGWGSLNEIAKALAIFEDPSMANINRRLGEMHKVRSFYNNIVNPYRGGSVTSDTHNVAAALLRPLSGSSPEVLHNLGAASSSNITGARGTYGLYADAVRRAAAERGITDPRAMQSITWEGIRGLYSPEMKRNKSLQERVSDAVNQYRLGRVTGGEMREQLLDLGGGIALPAWYVR